MNRTGLKQKGKGVAWITLVIAILFVVINWGIDTIPKYINENHILKPSESIGEIEDAQSKVLNAESDLYDFFDQDYYRLDPLVTRSYEAKFGQIDYCPLDDLKRPVCAYGILTQDLREEAKTRGRQSINVDPVGWPKNSEVLIPATDIEGSKDYFGWFWNRSHLMADSLGGDPIKENLVIGTRTQNVGSTMTDGEASGGMAFSERIARNYFNTSESANCPLYYAVSAQYQRQELIPRTTTVEMENCDKSISYLITIPNTANGWTIDYNNGTFWEERVE